MPPAWVPPAGLPERERFPRPAARPDRRRAGRRRLPAVPPGPHRVRRPELGGANRDRVGRRSTAPRSHRTRRVHRAGNRTGHRPERPTAVRVRCRVIPGCPARSTRASSIRASHPRRRAGRSPVRAGIRRHHPGRRHPGHPERTEPPTSPMDHRPEHPGRTARPASPTAHPPEHPVSTTEHSGRTARPASPTAHPGRTARPASPTAHPGRTPRANPPDHRPGRPAGTRVHPIGTARADRNPGPHSPLPPRRIGRRRPAPARAVAPRSPRPSAGSRSRRAVRPGPRRTGQRPAIHRYRPGAGCSSAPGWP